MAIRVLRKVSLCVLIISALIGAMFGQVPKPSQREGGLNIRDSQVPKGFRVVGLEIHLASGAFESVDDIPAGWHVEINNETSCKASLVAHANPGASALEEKGLQLILIQIAQTELEDQITNIWGWLNLVSDSGVEKRVGLSGSSFQFVERYARHHVR